MGLGDFLASTGKAIAKPINALYEADLPGSGIGTDELLGKTGLGGAAKAVYQDDFLGTGVGPSTAVGGVWDGTMWSLGQIEHKVWQPAARVLVTAQIQDDWTDDWGESWKAAKDISPGQAFTAALGNKTGDLQRAFGKDENSNVVDFLFGSTTDKDFDIRNADDREVFRHGGAMILSGSVDAVARWYLDPLVLGGKAYAVTKVKAVDQPIITKRMVNDADGGEARLEGKLDKILGPKSDPGYAPRISNANETAAPEQVSTSRAGKRVNTYTTHFMSMTEERRRVELLRDRNFRNSPATAEFLARAKDEQEFRLRLRVAMNPTKSNREFMEWYSMNAAEEYRALNDHTMPMFEDAARASAEDLRDAIANAQDPDVIRAAHRQSQQSQQALDVKRKELRRAQAEHDDLLLAHTVVSEGGIKNVPRVTTGQKMSKRYTESERNGVGNDWWVYQPNSSSAVRILRSAATRRAGVINHDDASSVIEQSMRLLDRAGHGFGKAIDPDLKAKLLHDLTVAATTKSIPELEAAIQNMERAVVRHVGTHFMREHLLAAKKPTETLADIDLKAEQIASALYQDFILRRANVKKTVENRGANRTKGSTFLDEEGNVVQGDPGTTGRFSGGKKSPNQFWDQILRIDGVMESHPLALTMMENSTALVDIDALTRLVRRQGKAIADNSDEFLKRVDAKLNGTGQPLVRGKDALDGAFMAFNHMWKPAQLLRLGWPMRVVVDETMRSMSVLGVLNHLSLQKHSLGNSLAQGAISYKLRDAATVARRRNAEAHLAGLRPTRDGAEEYFGTVIEIQLAHQARTSLNVEMNDVREQLREAADLNAGERIYLGGSPRTDVGINWSTDRVIDRREQARIINPALTPEQVWTPRVGGGNLSPPQHFLEEHLADPVRQNEALPPIRILITGSRDWPSEGAVHGALQRAIDSLPPGRRVIVVHGTAGGADQMAGRFAKNPANRAVEEPRPADWATHGRAAGFRRNQEMVDSGADLTLAFIKDNSRGATHAADAAEAAGIPVIRHRITNGEAEPLNDVAYPWADPGAPQVARHAVDPADVPTVVKGRTGAENEVYIGRPSKWGNPFKIGPDGTREEVIAKYEDYIRNNPELMDSLGELRGKTISCHCAPLPCHGDVLARLVAERIATPPAGARSAADLARDNELTETIGSLSNDMRNTENPATQRRLENEIATLERELAGLRGVAEPISSIAQLRMMSRAELVNKIQADFPNLPVAKYRTKDALLDVWGRKLAQREGHKVLKTENQVTPLSEDAVRKLDPAEAELAARLTDLHRSKYENEAAVNELTGKRDGLTEWTAEMEKDWQDHLSVAQKPSSRERGDADRPNKFAGPFVLTKHGVEYQFEDALEGNHGRMFADFASAMSTFRALANTNERYMNALRITGGDTTIVKAVIPDNLPLHQQQLLRETYNSGWKRAVNEQIGQDLMLRRILGGGEEAQTDNIVRWMNTTSEGQEYIRKVDNIRAARKEEWIEMARGHIDHYLPSQELKDLALAGKAERHHLDQWNAGRRDPETGLILGDAGLPAVHAQSLDLVLANSGFSNEYGRIIDRLYKGIGTAPTDVLSRHPFFAGIYRQEMRRQFDNLLLKEGDTISPSIVREMERSSRQTALREVKRTLYDVANESNLGHTLRFVFPFYSAWQDALGTWSRLWSEDPSRLAHVVQVWNAPQKTPSFYEDSNGAKYMGIPLPEAIKDKLGIPGDVDMPANWMRDLVFNGEYWYNPGIGVPVTVPVAAIVRDRPDLYTMLEPVIPYGAGDDMWDQILPAGWKKGVSLWSETDDEDYAKAQFRMWQDVYTDQRTTGGDLTDTQMWDEATRRTNDLFRVRMASNFALPFAPSMRSPYQYYIDKWKQLQEEYRINPGAFGGKSAQDQFIDTEGEEYFAFTLASTKSNVGGIAPTEAGYKGFNQYRDLVREMPELGSLIVGDSSGEYSAAVGQWMLDEKIGGGDTTRLRDIRDPKAGLVDLEVNRGWARFRAIDNATDAALAERGITSLRSNAAADIKAKRDILISRIKKELPHWAEEFSTFDRGKADRRVAFMEKLIDAPGVTERPGFRSLAQYLAARATVVQALAQRKSAGGSANLQAKTNLDLRTKFDIITSRLREGDTAFADLHTRWLHSDDLDTGGVI